LNAQPQRLDDDGVEILTDAQVSAAYDVSRTTLWRERKAGRLRPRRRHGRLEYRVDELDAWKREYDERA